MLRRWSNIERVKWAYGCAHTRVTTMSNDYLYTPHSMYDSSAHTAVRKMSTTTRQHRRTNNNIKHIALGGGGVQQKVPASHNVEEQRAAREIVLFVVFRCGLCTLWVLASTEFGCISLGKFVTVFLLSVEFCCWCIECIAFLL